METMCSFSLKLITLNKFIDELFKFNSLLITSHKKQQNQEGGEIVIVTKHGSQIVKFQL